MTLALSVVLAVAAVAAAVFGWTARRGSVARRRDQARLLRQSSRLRDADELVAKAEERAREADERASRAEERVREADERASRAEERVREAEGGPAASGSNRPNVSVDVALALEGVRVEREWLEVAGPGVELPFLWDGSLAVGVAMELAIIREVTGTPSELSTASTRPRYDPIALRVACEFLRCLARSGDEMSVEVTDEGIVVSQSQDQLPHLAELRKVAEQSGMAISAALDGAKVSTQLLLAPEAS